MGRGRGRGRGRKHKPQEGGTAAPMEAHIAMTSSSGESLPNNNVNNNDDQEVREW